MDTDMVLTGTQGGLLPGMPKGRLCIAKRMAGFSPPLP